MSTKRDSESHKEVLSSSPAHSSVSDDAGKKPVPMPQASKPAALAPAGRQKLAQGLRHFAQAVRHIHDLKTFLEIFQVGLENTGLCSEADFRVLEPDETGHRPESFGPGKLSLTVGTGAQIATVAKLAPPRERQHFGVEDLHMMAGLSELLGAAVDVAHRIGRDERAIAALKAVLNFAPVGICAFDELGRVDAVNALARGWLALAEGDAIATALPAGATFEDIRNGASFHLRVGGRLLFCESRPNVEGRYGALVVSDLTPEQGRLLDALNREVYRGNHLRRSLHFVLLERAQPMGVLLSAMPAMRNAMGQHAIVGPYDAARVGIIFPDSSWSAATLHLRTIAPVVGAAEVRLGRSGLKSFKETPEAVIETALDFKETLAAVIRPRILVHDEYRGVGDALKLVLGDDCEVVGSTDLGEAHRLIQDQHFDAVLADLNPAAGGPDLVATARNRNENVRAFYLSSTLPGALSGRVQSDVPVFSKPFNVEAVRDCILASLGSSEPQLQK